MNQKCVQKVATEEMLASEHNEVQGFTCFTEKSTRLSCTNFTHCLRRDGSLGNECIEMPSVSELFLHDSSLLFPATQYVLLFFFRLASSIFVNCSCHHTCDVIRVESRDILVVLAAHRICSGFLLFWAYSTSKNRPKKLFFLILLVNSYIMYLFLQFYF